MSKHSDCSQTVPSLPRLPRHARALQLLLPPIVPDRRFSERRPFEALVREFGGRPLGRAADLGVRGIKVLRGSKALPRCGPLTLSFCLPSGERLRVPAEVVFDRPQDGASSVRATGLRFCAIPKATELLLRSFLG